MSQFSSLVFRIQTFPCLQTNIFVSSLHGFDVHGMAIEYEPVDGVSLLMPLALAVEQDTR